MAPVLKAILVVAILLLVPSPSTANRAVQASDCDGCTTADRCFHSGLTSYNSKDHNKARACFEKALSIEPQHVNAVRHLAQLFMELGDLPRATQFYRRAIDLDDSDFLSRAQLGLLLSQQGDLQGAAEMYAIATNIRPDHPQLHNNLALVYQQLGQASKALQHYDLALKYAPTFQQALMNAPLLMAQYGQVNRAIRILQGAAERLGPSPTTGEDAQTLVAVWNTLGQVAGQGGKLDIAIDAFQRSLALHERSAEAHNNLGNIFRSQRRLDEALHHFEKSASYVGKESAHIPLENICACLNDLGRPRDALVKCDAAAKLNPDSYLVHALRASALQKLGQIDDAITALRQSLTIDKTAEACNNVGTLLHKAGRYNEALVAYEDAVNPQTRVNDAQTGREVRPAAERNIGNTLIDLRKYSDAIPHLERAIRLGAAVVSVDAPKSSPIYILAQKAAQHVSHPTGIVVREAFFDLVQARAYSARWDKHEEYFTTLRNLVYLGLQRGQTLSLNPFQALSFPWHGDDLLKISQDYTSQVTARPELASFQTPKRSKCHGSKLVSPDGHRRLRLGYVSSDIGSHALTHLMRSVFELHNHTQVSVYMYTTTDDKSEMRAKVASAVDNMRDISSSSLMQSYQRIQQDCLDVLIDLNGYTRKERAHIFATDPVDLQVHYMGYAGSLGSPHVPYIVTDPVVSPPEYSQFYSERLLLLPHSYFVNSHRAHIPSPALHPELVPSRADTGLPSEGFLFACFCGLQKVDPVIFRAWVQILRAVPGSTLWLLRFPPGGEAGIRHAVAAAGLDSHRVVFSDIVTPEEHIRRAANADLFLDTVAYNAHTTACDALWAGVPVVTLLGRTGKMADRVATSVLRAAHLPELVTSTIDEYMDLAITLATNAERLSSLRKKLSISLFTVPLFDTKLWVQDYERLLMALYDVDKLSKGDTRMHVVL